MTSDDIKKNILLSIENLHDFNTALKNITLCALYLENLHKEEKTDPSEFGTLLLQLRDYLILEYK